MICRLVGEAYGATLTEAGAYSWTPGENQGGADYSLTVEVTDGVLTVR